MILLLIPSCPIVMSHFRRWIQAVFQYSDRLGSSLSKEAAIKKGLLHQANVEHKDKESTSKDPSDNFEIDMSEGLAAQMFGILTSNDNEVIFAFA